MMEGLTESIEYYYDEDFSIPFDIDISEENNNSNTNQAYTYFRWMNIVDGEMNDKDDYDNYDLDQVIMPKHIFSQFKSSQNNHGTNKSHISQMNQSYNTEVKRTESALSAVRMSCSSSPNSGSSTANTVNVHNCIYFDSYTHNMSFNESNYSLKSRVPLLNQSNKNILANYHLNFALQDSFITSSILSDNKRSPVKFGQMTSQHSTVTDSGKCSSSTVDNFFIKNMSDDPVTFIRGYTSSNNKQLKPDAILWRRIKFLMLYHVEGWSLLKMFKQFRKNSLNKDVTKDDLVTGRLKSGPIRSKCYSCSVVEMYNSIGDSEKRLNFMITINNSTDHHKQSHQNVSCQFPLKNRRPISKEHSSPTKIAIHSYDYPGIGKVIMPRPTRLNASVFLSSNLQSQLSFLQSTRSNLSDTSYNRIHCVAPRKTKNTMSDKSMCTLNCPHNCYNITNGSTLLKPCLRKDEEALESKTVLLRSRSPNSLAATDHFKRKSVSFDCPRQSPESLVPMMKEIPRKWGLYGSEAKSSTDMMAIFDYSRRESFLGHSGSHESCPVNDDAGRFRDMVNDVLRLVKQISDRLSLRTAVTNTANNDSAITLTDTSKTFHIQLTELCEHICAGNCLDTPLATAIDNIIALLSDGLVATSFSGTKKVRLSSSTSAKAAMRLWLLVEETCRVSTTNVSLNRKSDFSNLLSEVRHTATKDHQVRLRVFVASALKSGLLHVWLRSVVANDSALQRFYCAEAFLRQARTSQSDALASVTVCLKTLTVGNDRPQPPPPTVVVPVHSRPGLPPPVKISRRFLTTCNRNIAKLAQITPLYHDETAESDSCADTSRSSQSDCLPNNNNIGTTATLCLFSRAATHPRLVKKSLSTTTNLDSVIHTSPVTKPPKSSSNHSCKSAALPRSRLAVSVPIKPPPSSSSFKTRAPPRSDQIS